MAVVVEIVDDDAATEIERAHTQLQRDVVESRKLLVRCVCALGDQVRTRYVAGVPADRHVSDVQ